VQYLTNSERVIGSGCESDRTSFVSYQGLDVAPNEETEAKLDKQWREDIDAMGLKDVEIHYKKVCGEATSSSNCIRDAC
jgi:hypothetical protein